MTPEVEALQLALKVARDDVTRLRREGLRLAGDLAVMEVQRDECKQEIEAARRQWGDQIKTSADTTLRLREVEAERDRRREALTAIAIVLEVDAEGTLQSIVDAVSKLETDRDEAIRTRDDRWARHKEERRLRGEAEAERDRLRGVLAEAATIVEETDVVEAPRGETYYAQLGDGRATLKAAAAALRAELVPLLKHPPFKCCPGCTHTWEP